MVSNPIFPTNYHLPISQKKKKKYLLSFTLNTLCSKLTRIHLVGDIFCFSLLMLPFPLSVSVYYLLALILLCASETTLALLRCQDSCISAYSYVRSTQTLMNFLWHVNTCWLLFIDNLHVYFIWTLLCNIAFVFIFNCLCGFTLFEKDISINWLKQPTADKIKMDNLGRCNKKTVLV